MKKIIALLIAAVFLLSGCGSTQPPAETDEKAAETQTSSVDVEATAEEPAENEKQETAQNTLVIYFSRTGEQYTVGVIEKGNTAIVAEMIGEATDADLYEVLPADDHYPTTYKELTDVGLQEQRDGARPAYAGELPTYQQSGIY